jgi:hypothetical protein
MMEFASVSVCLSCFCWLISVVFAVEVDAGPGELAVVEDEAVVVT